ncbi:30S ribosomal protein S7 [Candidatus Parcubacteria bacterium]|nr:30S ribosomal protein S7 [Candidatus Parcubacteria bacterium]
MGRGPRIKKKPLELDPVYKSSLITRLINRVMECGKKTTARKIVHGALASLAPDPKEAMRLFEEAMANIRPAWEVRSRRVGGATYQVPAPVKRDRAESLAIRWLVTAAREKKGKPMVEKLAEELQAALKKEGVAAKKKENMHRMAEANRAFAHFKW